MFAEHEFELLIAGNAMPGMTGTELIAAGLVLNSRLLASGYADLPNETPADVPRLSKLLTKPDIVRAIATLLG